MIRTTTTALALALMAGAAGAEPAQQCSEHDAMARHLAENWGESRKSVALDAASSMVELYASEETGTWTLTVTSPGGPTCMIASGHAFEMTQDELPVLDEGA
ncbi:hypothetical protein [Rubellimicrobium aerolatum]|uniref:PepSY domain-containing protein n=1 Tax=Rubellimicrobium aerolatum TaxID=490979 RepID=A0ABW0SAS7_9RHOB|nr:hypothetical protein [Rubellimicrobium aerolatum]MBP1805335.1 hypothetical protein [Rubellimicrobium aerolatum]